MTFLIKYFLRKDIKPLDGEASWWLALIFSRGSLTLPAPVKTFPAMA